MTIARNEPPKPPANGRTAAIVGSTAAVALFALIAGWEGKENDPYQDIVGIWTVCYGDTKNVRPGERQSDAQCAARLDQQIAAHAAPVLACAPGLRGKTGPLVASISLAYNIGPRAFCNSTVARRFNAGDISGGCDAMLKWNRAGGRVVRGLVRRREAERAICRGAAI